MRELILVVAAAMLAHAIAWCRDPMAGWRHSIEKECWQGVQDFHRVYGIEVHSDEAIVFPGWMAGKD